MLPNPAPCTGSSLEFLEHELVLQLELSLAVPWGRPQGFASLFPC